MAYMTAVGRFFGWCEQHQIGQLADIEPLHVAAYIEALGLDFEKPTVKQHLAGIRTLFDWLVTGQVVATNPAHAVRGPKHVVKTGKTTVLDSDQARTLLDSIDISTVVGLRDRALIALIDLQFCSCQRRRGDGRRRLPPQGQTLVGPPAHEKGGKRHEMPAHHNLEAYLDAYIEAAGIRDEKKRPPLPLGARAHRHAHRQPHAPCGRLAHGATARGRSWIACARGQSLVSCHRHYRLSERGWHTGKRAGDGRT
jgi:integrase/recombinase XerC